MDLEEAIRTRRSMRGFLDVPVPRAAVERILELASCAPSGSNIQPWKVVVVVGEAKHRLVERVQRARREEPGKHKPEYDYYMEKFREPYLSRRRACGWGLYELAGIERGDREASLAFSGRNFDFWDAPVGMIFTLDKDMGQGAWVDFGMFLQTLMLAARGEGLHTCPQAAWRNFPDLLRDELGIPGDETVVCGLSLGWLDEEAPENALRTGRAPVAEFARFLGFDDLTFEDGSKA
ncbi:MAG: nitroreductase [Acetobacterales bacterium]